MRLPQQENPSSRSFVQNQTAASVTNSTRSTLQYENTSTYEDVLEHEHNQHETELSQFAVATSMESSKLTSAILRESATFLAPGEQERDIVKVFDVKSFDFHDPEKLSQQYNYEFVSVAGHFNDGKLSFPESPCSPLCRGVECECLLNQFKTFKDVWFVENEAGHVEYHNCS